MNIEYNFISWKRIVLLFHNQAMVKCNGNWTHGSVSKRKYKYKNTNWRMHLIYKFSIKLTLAIFVYFENVYSCISIVFLVCLCGVCVRLYLLGFFYFRFSVLDIKRNWGNKIGTINYSSQFYVCRVCAVMEIGNSFWLFHSTRVGQNTVRCCKCTQLLV